MICELCGNHMESGKKIKLEGSIVTACHKCAGSGEVVGEVSSRHYEKPSARKTKVESPSEFNLDVKYDVIEDYAGKIHGARERKGLKQSDLGKSVNEPESLIHRIEAGRITPTVELARKLEKKLGVKLLTPHAEGAGEADIKHLDDLTLGDMVVIKERNKKK